MEKIESFRNARDTLKNVLLTTHLVYSSKFSRLTGNNVYFKPENMQLTGSFKIRGAYYKIAKVLSKSEVKGFVTSSAGNHAQGVAYAASVRNVEATIVMPANTPLVKVNNTKGYGAKVILHGECYDDAYAHAMEISEKEGLTFIHPFNDEDVATGQGTIAYEILQDLPDTDIILVPIGGGGLIAGIASLVKLLNPNVKVIGVEPTGAACAFESLNEGKIVTLPELNTIADGVAVKTPGDIVYPYIQKNVDDIITIDDSELIDAFLAMMEGHKMIVENSGLLSVAALKHLNVKDKNIVPILSGGNIDVLAISSMVQHGLINRGRIFSFSVRLPDRPGELNKITRIIAGEKGNFVKLEHNKFVNINRNTAVELEVTLEAFGHEHKETILKVLRENGYNPKIIQPTSIS